MAQFQTGNRMWEFRSKVGRERLFKHWNLMWKGACQYFEWCDENPWVKEVAQVVDKKVVKTEVSMGRPYTWEGLTRYLGCNKEYFAQFRKDKEKCTPDFSRVIDAIESVIYQQKFEGAAVNAFNANIISRELGLVDKKDITSDGEKIQTVIQWGDKEIKV